jgi:hypothetical protein
MQCNRGMSPGQAVRLASERTLNGRDYPCNKCGVYLGTRPGNTLTKRKTNHPYALKNAARHGWDCEVIWRRENRRLGVSGHWLAPLVLSLIDWGEHFFSCLPLSWRNSIDALMATAPYR